MNIKKLTVNIWMVLACCTIASAQSDKAVGRNTAEVKAFLDQLKSMDDETVQAKADELAAKLLADLEHRPAIEANNARVQTWLSLQSAALARKELVTSSLEKLREQLAGQISRIEAANSDPSRVEARKRNAIDTFWIPIHMREAELKTLDAQLKTLAVRIADESSIGEIRSDNWRLAIDVVNLPPAPMVLPIQLKDTWAERLPLKGKDTGSADVTESKLARRTVKPSLTTEEMMQQLGVKR